MVMPEIGLDDDPIRPTIRDETVTKKKPKMMTRIEATKLPWVGRRGRQRQEQGEQQRAGQHHRHRHVALGAGPAAAAGVLRAQIADAVAKRRDDGRNGAGQRDQPGRQHRARSGVADVGAPQLAGRHLVDAQPARRNRRERHRQVVAEDAEERQQHQPRQDAAGEHHAGDPRPDHVADAHVLRRDVDVERGVREARRCGRATGRSRSGTPGRSRTAPSRRRRRRAP